MDNFHVDPEGVMKDNLGPPVRKPWPPCPCWGWACEFRWEANVKSLFPDEYHHPLCQERQWPKKPDTTAGGSPA